MTDMDDLKTLVILFKAQAALEKHVKKSLEATQLSVNEFTAMEALYTKGALSAQGLIDLVLIPNSSMTYVLDTLSQKNLITRKRDASDRRVHRINLTDAGRQLFEQVYSEHQRHMREIFGYLSEEEEIQLQALLRKLGRHAEKQLNKQPDVQTNSNEKVNT